MFKEAKQEELFSIRRQSARYLKLRRIFEILLIIIFLPLIISVFIILSFIVLFDGNYKILFKQKRIGKDEKEFEIYKFQTIKYSEIDDKNNISKIGYFLRKHRLDEIPQLINLFKGEIALIGPRPEVVEEYIKFKSVIPNYNQRKLIPQGISGWAQVNHPHFDTIEGNKKKLEYDFYYIENLSLKLDMIIVIKTILFILSGKL